ncbi:hypothetical protein ILUMI_06466 [Ignelater luminosus]|uniref:Protein AATF n=1 Tax=Ignelater luminosus TaxID=2038154 RepID=A0A8K0D5C7_IGNLU|nr:hypothetical protein ILUMI_06466 [Ignelater luminosus]
MTETISEKIAGILNAAPLSFDPEDDIHEETHKCGNQFTDKVSESKKNVSNLLDKFLELQSLLLKKYPETKKLLSGNTQLKEVESDEEIPSDTDDEQINEVDENSDEETPRKKLKISDYKAEIEKRHKLYKDYRNSVIHKWNDKTRIAPSKSGGLVHSVTNQIEHILSDKEKLIKRTQLKRTDYEIVGQQKSNEDNETSQDQSVEVHDSNIFDDTDFYHHLLRELIECKSADVTDPVQLGRQWMQLQNLRSKMKRKIDTKATKGRKIRYVVHSKLVNFMAPIEDNNNSAVTDLCGSLFGKNQVF